MASTARVIVADRDPGLRRVLANRLEAEGYTVRVFEDLIAALANTLPDHRGETGVDAFVVTVEPHDTVLLRRQDRGSVPMLAHAATTSDALDVIDAGADDFVIKPFSPRELVTRLNSILRRYENVAPWSPQYVYGELTIDPMRREVFVRGIEVALPAKEFDLLVFLASSPKQVFTRTQLMNQVWGTDAAVSTATITEHIRRLRQRIEIDPRQPRWIQTVWSVGYRFNP